MRRPSLSVSCVWCRYMTLLPEWQTLVAAVTANHRGFAEAKQLIAALRRFPKFFYCFVFFYIFFSFLEVLLFCPLFCLFLQFIFFFTLFCLFSLFPFVFHKTKTFTYFSEFSIFVWIFKKSLKSLFFSCFQKRFIFWKCVHVSKKYGIPNSNQNLKFQVCLFPKFLRAFLKITLLKKNVHHKLKKRFTIYKLFIL